MSLSLYLFVLISLLFAPQSETDIDFTDDANWYIVNDGVMGGLSKGNEEIENGKLTFSGTISLENNGGFSWVKSDGWSADLSGYEKVTITYKTDDRGYDLTFETPSANNIALFQKRLPNTDGKWRTQELNLSDFEYTIFGQKNGKTFTNRDEVIHVGIILADKRSGAFKMQVEEISFD